MEPNRPDVAPPSVSIALADALEAAVRGEGRVVLLSGEAGIGKTTAARRAATSARRRGARVRWSACSAGGATVAHAPWLMALAGLGDPGRTAIEALVEVDPEDSLAAAAARGQAYAAVATALEASSAEVPLLLVLDDLHWADEGSLRLLDVVAAQLPAMRVLLVGTYRDTDLPPGATLGLLGGRADRVALECLDAAGVATILEHHAGAPAAELVEEVIRLTGGNPFLVVQIGRLLAGGVTDLHRVELPRGTRDLLRQRLAALDQEDRALLTAAAVLGRSFRQRDVAELLDRDDDEVIGPLERAAAFRIVERVPGAGLWAFVHDLFRQAALASGTGSEIQVHHLTAARLGERTGAEPSVIATHLESAGPDQAVPAAAWSVRAGERALAALAWEEAAGHHRRALDLLPYGADPQIRADALAGLGRARLLGGDYEAGRRAFLDLAEIARSNGSPALLARAALGFSADLAGFEVRLFDQRQIDLLEESARRLDPAGPPALRATVLARLSVALSLTAPDTRRLSLAEQAVALAREADDPIVLARTLAAHCDAIAGPAHVEQRLDQAGEIIDIAVAAADGPLELLGRRLSFVARLEQGDLTGVEREMANFARRADTVDNPLYSWYVPLWQAQFALVAGDVDAALRLVSTAERIGAAAGSLNCPMLAVVLRLVISWQREEYDHVLTVFDQLVQATPELADHLSSVGAEAASFALAGRADQATALLDRLAGRGVTGTPSDDAEWLADAFNVLRTAVLLDHPILPRALAALEPYADLMAFEGIGAGLYGSVGRMVALGCRKTGRTQDAVRHATASLAASRAFGGVIAADAWQTLAECLESAGQAQQARAAHAEAARIRSGFDRAPDLGPATPQAVPQGAPNELRRDGDVWHLRYDQESAILKHSKGLADLAVLLARPGQELHVTELAGVPAALVSGSGGDALDRRAIDAYRRRLTDLAVELDDARADHDLGRAEHLQIEYDALVDQLSGAVGLGGRSRPVAAEPIERLRKAVTARIRDAITRIESVHPPLARHLGNAVHTGTYLTYTPEPPTTWHCYSRSGDTKA